MVKVALLGYFDIIHAGHKKLISKIKYNFPKSKIIVYTINYKKNSQIPLDKRVENLKKYVNDVVVLDFDEVRNWSPILFINYLKNEDVKVVAAGHDYHFGKNRQGNINLLKKYFLTVTGIYKINQSKYSTTVIKKNLLNTKIVAAKNHLNSDVVISGKVLGGEQIGRTLGFPTINLKPDLVLKNGVYIVEIIHDNKKYFGMANYGLNPTFDFDSMHKFEINIFDFDQEIYGELVHIHILEYIRPEIKFNSIVELKTQIQNDEIYVRNKILNYT